MAKLSSAEIEAVARTARRLLDEKMRNERVNRELKVANDPILGVNLKGFIEWKKTMSSDVLKKMDYATSTIENILVNVALNDSDSRQKPTTTYQTGKFISELHMRQLSGEELDVKKLIADVLENSILD